MTTTLLSETESLFNNNVLNASSISIAPGSGSNLKKSIDNPMDVGDGRLEYAWAFNKRFQSRFEDLKIGDAIVFGNSTQKNIRVCFVKEKLQDMSNLQQWPYKSKTWGYGFYLSKPMVLKNISYKKVVGVTGYKMFPTQLKLNNEDTQNVKELILIR